MEPGGWHSKGAPPSTQGRRPIKLISGRSHQPRERSRAHGITGVEAAVRTLAIILPGPGCRPGAAEARQAGQVKEEAADSHPGAERREGEVMTVADRKAWQHLLRDL